MFENGQNLCEYLNIVLSVVVQDQPPATVASLLNSLGLGKYTINFQAEEVNSTMLIDE